MKRLLPVCYYLLPDFILQGVDSLILNVAASVRKNALKTCFTFLLFIFWIHSFAQTIDPAQQQTEYKKVVIERVKKIINTLNIIDSTKYKNVVSAVADHYFGVNTIGEKNSLAVKEIKQKALAKPETDAAIKLQEDKKSAKLLQQHNSLITNLNKYLNAEQIDKVKNGMTYNVLNVTYKGYQDMIPTLKAEEKEKIYDWLVEARELAMDAESSDKKHAVFGKYKGRINNYLSAQGYDSQKEREGWEARIKAKKDSPASSN